ncbi:MAG: helix-turn-helix domain-containing protein [Clostridia bacterium]|nr:helix-turn-helix domain-containing protein [Clostridia bacterium]
MDDLYPIGKVAKIMGVSVQTLRYYSNIGLISPAYINPTTGYRYYSVDQLHFIDRIKYLQTFGLNLNEIKDILVNNDIPLLLKALDRQKEVFREEISRIEDILDSIEWYKNYFTYVDADKFDSNCYSLHLDRRYMVVAKCRENEPKQDFHIRLNEIKNSPRFRDLPLKRQFSYILDYDALMNGELEPRYLGLFLKHDPPFESENIIEIPEGDYLCFKARILSEGWNPYFAKLFFDGKPKPTLVLANEYEDNLHEYSRCVYEVQILIPKTN